MKFIISDGSVLFTGGHDNYTYSMNLETLTINKSIKMSDEEDYWARSCLAINNHLIIGTNSSLRILTLPDLKQTLNIKMKD